MTQAEGTPAVGHRRGRFVGWFTAAVAAVSVPTVAVLALTGNGDQATAVGIIGGAVATAGGIRITVNVRR